MTIIDDNTGLLISAMKFSAFRHRSQRRKDAEGSAYINHPIQVMELIWRVGGIRESDVLIAALLHDTLEDTVKPKSVEKAKLEEEIAGLFSKQVLELVLEVTDDKTKDSEVRKQLQIEHARTLSPGAKLIKLADKTCNVQDIMDHPPVFWCSSRKHEYLDWAERVVNKLRGTNTLMEQNFDRVLADSRKRVR